MPAASHPAFERKRTAGGNKITHIYRRRCQAGPCGDAASVLRWGVDLGDLNDCRGHFALRRGAVALWVSP